MIMASTSERSASSKVSELSYIKALSRIDHWFGLSFRINQPLTNSGTKMSKMLDGASNSVKNIRTRLKYYSCVVSVFKVKSGESLTISPVATTCHRCIHLRTYWDITRSFPSDHHGCNKECKQYGTKDITLFSTNNTVKRLSDIIKNKFNKKACM